MCDALSVALCRNGLRALRRAAWFGRSPGLPEACSRRGPGGRAATAGRHFGGKPGKAGADPTHGWRFCFTNKAGGTFRETGTPPHGRRLLFQNRGGVRRLNGNEAHSGGYEEGETVLEACHGVLRFEAQLFRQC